MPGHCTLTIRMTFTKKIEDRPDSHPAVFEFFLTLNEAKDARSFAP